MTITFLFSLNGAIVKRVILPRICTEPVGMGGQNANPVFFR